LGIGFRRIAAVAGGEAKWSYRPDPDIRRSRKRPSNSMEADVEISSLAINADLMFGVALRQ
jgi:hypothetical protein